MVCCVRCAVQRDSDGAYRELPLNQNHPLPELLDLPSPVMSVGFGVARSGAGGSGLTRVVAAGCQSGLVSLSTLPLTTAPALAPVAAAASAGAQSEAPRAWECDITQTYIDGPVSSLALFSSSTLHPALRRFRTGSQHLLPSAICFALASLFSPLSRPPSPLPSTVSLSCLI